MSKKNYNTTPQAKAAKRAWRDSDAGKQYMREYHAKYMANPENARRKAEAQKLRRASDLNRKEIDKTYNFHYVRREDFKQKKNLKRRLRRQTDTAYRLTERLRGRLKAILGDKRPEALSKSLGCTSEELVAYLESQFSPGMCWENYGLYGWHIDHIKPLSSFDLTDKVQYSQACRYTNLRPLWAQDNLKKGKKAA